MVDRKHTSLAALAIADLVAERGDWDEAEDMLAPPTGPPDDPGPGPAGEIGGR